MGKQSRYERRGVSSKKEDVHNAIKHLDKGLYPNAFCKILPDLFGRSHDYCTIMHADGAGTKSSLAYVYWKETGDLSVWKGVVQDAIVMNIDDLLCAGVTNEPILVSMSIGRNKNLVPGEVITACINGAEEFLKKLRGYGLNIHLTGGETADVGDLVRTIIIDATVTVRMRQKDVIQNGIQPYDKVIGFASDGKASYEDSINSGLGSNGLTSARHDLFDQYVGLRYPESYDPHMPASLVYSGKHKLTETTIGSSDLSSFGLDLGRFVLSPTRTYAPVMLALKKAGLNQHVHGAIHCSGGGQTKALNFLRGVSVVKDDLFHPTPLLFRLIQEESGTPWKEMYQAFNMGHRLELYIPPDQAVQKEIIAIANHYGIKAKEVGRCEPAKTESVVIKTQHGKFTYE